jgi:hypothetical protein
MWWLGRLRKKNGVRRYAKKTGPEIIFKGGCGMKESEEINPKLIFAVIGPNR